MSMKGIHRHMKGSMVSNAPLVPFAPVPYKKKRASGQSLK
jgi:hypothetical protein